LKIENLLPKNPRYFVKEFIHVYKIKIGHSEVCVIYHHAYWSTTYEKYVCAPSINDATCGLSYVKIVQLSCGDDIQKKKVGTYGVVKL